MKKSSLIWFGAGCAAMTVAGIGASRLLAAAGGRAMPVLAAMTTTELPGEAAARELVLETMGDCAAVRRVHPLTDEQREKIAAVLLAHRDEVVVQAHARLQAQRGLRAAILDSGDETMVRAAAGRVGAVMAEGAVLRQRIAQDVRPLLTPEQATAWRAVLERIDDRLDVFFATQL